MKDSSFENHDKREKVDIGLKAGGYWLLLIMLIKSILSDFADESEHHIKGRKDFDEPMMRKGICEWTSRFRLAWHIKDPERDCLKRLSKHLNRELTRKRPGPKPPEQERRG